jgi:hypothetical protein
MEGTISKEEQRGIVPLLDHLVDKETGTAITLAMVVLLLLLLLQAEIGIIKVAAVTTAVLEGHRPNKAGTEVAVGVEDIEGAEVEVGLEVVVEDEVEEEVEETLSMANDQEMTTNMVAEGIAGNCFTLMQSW